MTNEEYLIRLNAEVLSETVPGVAEYFNGHLPRFVATLDAFRKHLSSGIELVYDMGTGDPFTSYWFNLTQGARVMFGMPQPHRGPVNEMVTPLAINLCIDRPPLEMADLVICTECLEHLPCNLYKVRAYLMSIVKPGGHLLLSFPLGGANAKGYWRDDLGDKLKISNPHIREFTQETAREFAYGTGWDMVDEFSVYTSAYGGQMMHAILKNTTEPTV